MKTRLFNLWYSFRASYWFVPLVMATLSIALSFGTTVIDSSLPPFLAGKLGWLYSGGAEGARTILSTVAGSMITTAGVVFSITIVVLSLTSSQFGPRLLGNFMRDTGTQVVLGTFISTFIYCIFVLRVVRNDKNGLFIPHLSVTFAFILALTSTCVLIYFIHHVASSIQADSIIASVYRDLENSIDRLFPESQEHGAEAPAAAAVEKALPEGFDEDGWPVASTESGYLQAIDLEGLTDLAREHDLILRLHFRPGEFIAAGAVLALAWPREHWDEKLTSQVNSAMIRGRQRTDEQDMGFAVKQLVEVALRALSPGINDPFTAMTCIDWLSAALSRVARRKFPSPLRYDKDSNLRLITVPVTFAEIVEAAFGQIRHAAGMHTPVTLRLLNAIAVVAPHVRTEAERDILERHATLIDRSGQEAGQVKDDRQAVEKRYQETLRLLGR
jgi:uncharacterized membrane protein